LARYNIYRDGRYVATVSSTSALKAIDTWLAETEGSSNFHGPFMAIDEREDLYPRRIARA